MGVFQKNCYNQFMPSIRWIRTVQVNEKETTLEIMLGSRNISDKCYVRINQNTELYFKADEDSRAGVISKGIEILKNHFANDTVTYPNGTPYDWT